jgi:hypothetical protein
MVPQPRFRSRIDTKMPGRGRAFFRSKQAAMSANDFRAFPGLDESKVIEAGIPADLWL